MASRPHHSAYMEQLSYLVKLTDGRIFQCHVDHLQKSFITSNTIPDTVPEDYSDVVFPDQVTQNNNGTRRNPIRDRRYPEKCRP